MTEMGYQNFCQGEKHRQKYGMSDFGTAKQAGKKRISKTVTDCK